MKTQYIIPETTVDDVKSFLRENWEEGCICGACGQIVKKYRRPITSSMALALILISKEGNEYSPNFIHLETFFKNMKGLSQSTRGDVPKLKYWGLITHNEDKEGEYKITQKGLDFAQGKITVKSHCLLYNNKCYGIEGKEVSIRECLKTKFNYELLMQGVL